MTGALAAALVTGGLLAPATASAAAPLDEGAHSRSAKVPTSAYAILKGIAVGVYPWAVAVNDAADTVYVTNAGSDTVSIIDGRTGSVRSTVAVGSAPWGVAVNQSTGTVYVANSASNTVSILDGRTATVTATVTVGESPQGVAVNNATGAVYVANAESDSVSVLDGRTGTVTSTIAVVGTPFGVSVNRATGAVYVVGAGAGNSTDTNVPSIVSPGFVAVIDGRTGALVRQFSFGVGPWSVAVHDADDRVYVNDTWLEAVSAFSAANPSTWASAGGQYWAVAVDQANGTAYATVAGGEPGGGAGLVSIFGGGSLASSITLRGVASQQPAASRGVAVDQAGAGAGVAYVAALDSNAVFAIGRATASSSPGTGAAGDTVRISLSVPHLPSGLAMDDSTVASVTFGGVAGTSLAAGAGNTWTVKAPRGKGSVPVVVSLNGGQRAQAGTFAYGSSATQ